MLAGGGGWGPALLHANQLVTSGAWQPFLGLVVHLVPAWARPVPPSPGVCLILGMDSSKREGKSRSSSALEAKEEERIKRSVNHFLPLQKAALNVDFLFQPVGESWPGSIVPSEASGGHGQRSKIPGNLEALEGEHFSHPQATFSNFPWVLLHLSSAPASKLLGRVTLSCLLSRRAWTLQ